MLLIMRRQSISYDRRLSCDRGNSPCREYMRQDQQLGKKCYVEKASVNRTQLLSPSIHFSARLKKLGCYLSCKYSEKDGIHERIQEGLIFAVEIRKYLDYFEMTAATTICSILCSYCPQVSLISQQGSNLWMHHRGLAIEFVFCIGHIHHCSNISTFQQPCQGDRQGSKHFSYHITSGKSEIQRDMGFNPANAYIVNIPHMSTCSTVCP